MTCALCSHPREDHTPRCTHVVGVTEGLFGYVGVPCDCPGFEPPEDEENN